MFYSECLRFHSDDSCDWCDSGHIETLRHRSNNDPNSLSRLPNRCILISYSMSRKFRTFFRAIFLIKYLVQIALNLKARSG